MTNCNCDLVNDILDENQKLKKAYDEVCAERDELKEKIEKHKKLANMLYGTICLSDKNSISIEPYEYEAACKERDRLKEENKNLYRLCNQLSAEICRMKGEDEDGVEED